MEFPDIQQAIQRYNEQAANELGYALNSSHILKIIKAIEYMDCPNYITNVYNTIALMREASTTIVFREVSDSDSLTHCFEVLGNRLVELENHDATTTIRRLLTIWAMKKTFDHGVQDMVGSKKKSKAAAGKEVGRIWKAAFAPSGLSDQGRINWWKHQLLLMREIGELMQRWGSGAALLLPFYNKILSFSE